jgi:hypothetical protein
MKDQDDRSTQPMSDRTTGLARLGRRLLGLPTWVYALAVLAGVLVAIGIALVV